MNILQPRKRYLIAIVGLMLLVAHAVIAGSLAQRGMGELVDGMTSLACAIIFGAPCLGLYFRRMRPFSIGFALLSWGYILVLLLPLSLHIPKSLAF